jgi:hypothetical protein
MALEKQIHLYSIDTSKFYTDKENELHRKKSKASYVSNKVKDRLKKSKKKNGDKSKEYIWLDKWNKRFLKIKNERKKELKEEIIKTSSYNIENKNPRVLNYRNSRINDFVVSEFTSSMTRALELEENKITEDIIIIRVYFVEILRDLLSNGFIYNGEKYIYFSSSAGQIRTKKVVFVKESKWNLCKNRLMCGLSEDIINAKGGCNTNKFLAYLSLSNSATDTWEHMFNTKFDISRCIVVDDFETNVTTEYDHVSSNDFSINRVRKDSLIPHMDGCGIISKKICESNFMVRMPWIKGLLASFDFNKFIEESNSDGIVTDIYGKKYNVIEDGIEIILTKSQFKMYKYYDSWQQYINLFNKYNCECGICNFEPKEIKNSRINYQMLQTLTDIRDEELEYLIKESNANIKKLSTDFKYMLNVFGVNGNSGIGEYKSNLQSALSIYPELINDPYTKATLYEIKNAMIKRYRGGKLEVNGKYIFIVPDLYAFCQWLFLKQDNPIGILEDKTVSCKIYKDKKKLDLLRAPHLYREHAIEENVYSSNSDCKKWFHTNAVYVSIHDPISKILVFDVDGDKSLVVGDETFVKVAERNMKGIVPLLYDLKKSEPERLSPEMKYKGLTSAFKANIGTISNNITKVWNSGHVGLKELEIIKWLCALNNAEIDYAKTLWRPSTPDDNKEIMKLYLEKKVPHFFIYAKNKEKDSVERVNSDSTMGKIEKGIKDVRLNFKCVPKLDKVDYKKMMFDANTTIDNVVIELYNKLSMDYGIKISNIADNDDADLSSLLFIIKEQFSEFGYSEIQISDILTKYLYCDTKGIKKGKQIYWYAYGGYIVDNLKNNIDKNTKVCYSCGSRVDSTNIRNNKCKSCRDDIKENGVKKVICIDCGIEFEVQSNNVRTLRCDKCKDINRKKQKLETWNKNKENYKTRHI